MRIVDVVEAECLRETDKVGATTLQLWFQQLDGEKYAAKSNSLLLLEDSRFGDGAIRLGYPEVYALSTRAFLTTLQNFGRIPSALDILREIIAAGRTVSPYVVDRPGRLGLGTKSQWTDSLQDGPEANKIRALIPGA